MLTNSFGGSTIVRHIEELVELHGVHLLLLDGDLATKEVGIVQAA